MDWLNQFVYDTSNCGLSGPNLHQFGDPKNDREI